jgi:alpha-amylase/alpha-mannosidase (GH57 family)
MPQIYLCFVWHMHQPFYKDLLTGEYRLPWTRMHALKDYYGMVKILDEFPGVHQTFNLVPSMMVQIEDYASGRAADPFLRCALKPAEELTEHEQAFILQYFFHANPARMIYRYPRYRELYEAWEASGRNAKRAHRLFGAAEMRDLQMLSQVAWFDEEDLADDPEIRDLVRKGRGFTLLEQAMLGQKQLHALGRVLPTYREFAARGQIEISTTPFYHPILPLLCDSNIANISHPYVPLPSQFAYPEDARVQLVRAREYVRKEFDRAPVGLWPSEGSVSDQALALAAETGFEWAASDNGVLARTIHQEAGPSVTYRPYLWKQGENQIRMLFRDHRLSDLIGFVYSRMGAAEAAGHFLGQIHDNCRDILARGADALVPIILDGENAWEYYDRNGRPFLRELYRRIVQDPAMSALTVSEALARTEPLTLDHIFPASWIGANFDIWIGAEEDNRAWDYLLRARRTYQQMTQPGALVHPTEEQKNLAYEEVLIAEGSDWNWWYGPEHESANRPEFDQLYRSHLANIYSALGLHPPEELSRPILRVEETESHDVPTGPIRATIDGEVSSYFEWLGAGYYRVDSRSGAMHGQRFLIRELRYGSDGSNLYLRLDFEEKAQTGLNGALVKLNAAPAADPAHITSVDLPLEQGKPGTANGIDYAFRNIYEVRIPMSAIGAGQYQPVRFQLSLWQNGLPLDALPPQGWLEVETAEPVAWGF